MRIILTVPTEVYGISFRWVMECRLIRGLSTDCVRQWPSTGAIARGVHGFLRQGQSASWDYFQFVRHSCFLRYPSFGMNKPGRSLLTLQWLPIELVGRGNYSTLVSGFSSGHASLQPCQRALGGLSPTELTSGNLSERPERPRDAASLSSHWRAAWARWLALPRAGSVSGILRIKAKSYP